MSGTSDLPLAAILKPVVDAIIEVFLLCVVGYFLSKRGIIDDAAKKKLNKVNVSLFTPALLFSKVAFTLTPEKLAQLYIVPIGFVIVTLVSALSAWALSILFRLRKSQRAFAIASSCILNANSLPVALMQSLVATVPILKWGEHDNKDQMLGRSLTYLVLFSTLGMVFRWSYGMKLLSTADEDASDSSSDSSSSGSDNEDGNSDDDDQYQSSENDRLLGGRSDTVSSYGTLVNNNLRQQSTSSLQQHQHQHQQQQEQEPQQLLGTTTPPKTTTIDRSKPKNFISFPGTPEEEYPNDNDNNNNNNNIAQQQDSAEWGAPRGVGRQFISDADSPTKSFFIKIHKRIKKICKKISNFMTVPLYASILSIVVALIPTLQSFIDNLKPLKSSLKNAGNVSVPLTIVVLGAYFNQPKQDEFHVPQEPQSRSSMYFGLPLPSFHSIKHALNNAKRQGHHHHYHHNHHHHHNDSSSCKTCGEKRTVFVAIVSRMIITPVILLPLFYLFAIKTVNVADDPVFVVTSALIIGSPPAITLAQITSAAGPQFERLISKTLFYSYAILTPPTTIALVIIGLLIDKAQNEAGTG